MSLLWENIFKSGMGALQAMVGASEFEVPEFFMIHVVFLLWECVMMDQFVKGLMRKDQHIF